MGMFDAAKKIKEGIEHNNMSMVADGYFSLTGEKANIKTLSTNPFDIAIDAINEARNWAGSSVSKIEIEKKQEEPEQASEGQALTKKRGRPKKEIKEIEEEITKERKFGKNLKFMNESDYGKEGYTKDEEKELEELKKLEAETNQRKLARRKENKVPTTKCVKCGKPTSLYISRRDEKTYLCNEHHNEAITESIGKKDHRTDNREGE